MFSFNLLYYNSSVKVSIFQFCNITPIPPLTHQYIVFEMVLFTIIIVVHLHSVAYSLLWRMTVTT